MIFERHYKINGKFRKEALPKLNLCESLKHIKADSRRDTLKTKIVFRDLVPKTMLQNQRDENTD